MHPLCGIFQFLLVVDRRLGTIFSTGRSSKSREFYQVDSHPTLDIVLIVNAIYGGKDLDANDKFTC